MIAEGEPSNRTVHAYITNEYDDIVTPINVDNLERLLIEMKYDQKKINQFISGFQEGFDLGYWGPVIRQDYSKNLPFTVGDSYDMWEKIMKEVKLNRYVGPFKTIPHDNFIQSLIGLVPKDQGKKT